MDGANDATLMEVYAKTENDFFIEKARSIEHKTGMENVESERLERETQTFDETFVARTPFGFDVNDLVRKSPADLAKSLNIDKLGKMKLEM